MPDLRPARPDIAETARMRHLRLQTLFLGIIAFALVLFLLVQARFVLIALVIAIILFSLTSEAINAIARIRIGPAHVPNWLATLVALALIAAGLLWASLLVAGQINQVVAVALSYAERAQTAAAELFAWLGPRAGQAIQEGVRSINLPAYVRSAAGQATNLMSMSVLITLFVGFLFAERIWFSTKLRRLLGGHEQAAHAEAVARRIMHRVNRYLVVKAAVSAVTALAVWVIFTAAKLELALPVATLTFALNFIPSVGSIISTLLAGLVVFVQTGDAATTALVTAGAAAVQFAIGNVLDPMLLGRTLRLSSFGIILSLAFWGAVWGLAGMFLAVPIMVAVMILCAQSDWLRPLAILLSREGLAEAGD